jgi:membrane-bound serine protease (ClpP class)
MKNGITAWLLIALLVIASAAMASPRTPRLPGLPVGIVLPIGFTVGSDSVSISDTSAAKPKVIKGQKRVYKFDLTGDIDSPSWRHTQAAFSQAEEMNADYVIIHMNTLGGTMDAADRIRGKILGSNLPVMVFIDNSASSAGALISIAADSIYMSPGANIGNAKVSDHGAPAPKEHQSYMRSMLRSTAQRNKRDPRIADAMSDPGKEISYTATEALENHYCEGIAKNIDEVMHLAGIDSYELVEYKPTVIDKISGFLLYPFISSFLIMLIIGGIYFEMRTPGTGFALFVAITGAILYFSPLYLHGLAAGWEIAVFILGIILIGIEVLARHRFGIIGIAGILLSALGLTLSLADQVPANDNLTILPESTSFIKAFFTVGIAMMISLALSIKIGGRLLKRSLKKTQ